ncbi:phosphatase PAP2 family protein [Endozoicomonas sp. Mp262]|uniref:phosphatase PAP2 family protein n=1 Tax=Endozoicomonas sp. Mp262 TaxID=2919499 RepID=UPI0021D95346
MKKSYLGGYLLGILATLVSITFFDRTVATFAYEHQLRGDVFKAMTWPADLLQILVAVLLVACLSKPWRQRVAGRVSTLLIALSFAWAARLFTKLAFGRTWPDTWIDNNPSWLQNGIEGFFPFTGGKAYSAFPSGHALVTFALATVFWHTAPKYRWLWSLSCLSLMAGMLGQYYHYLGDLLAGATLGCFCGHMAIALKHRIRRSKNDSYCQ